MWRLGGFTRPRISFMKGKECKFGFKRVKHLNELQIPVKSGILKVLFRPRTPKYTEVMICNRMLKGFIIQNISVKTTALIHHYSLDISISYKKI